MLEKLINTRCNQHWYTPLCDSVFSATPMVALLYGFEAAARHASISAHSSATDSP